MIWLCDTGHIGIHGGADVRTYGRSWRHGYKTKFSSIDGLSYFLKCGAPRLLLSSAIKFIFLNQAISTERDDPCSLKTAHSGDQSLLWIFDALLFECRLIFLC